MSSNRCGRIVRCPQCKSAIRIPLIPESELASGLPIACEAKIAIRKSNLSTPSTAPDLPLSASAANPPTHPVEQSSIEKTELNPPPPIQRDELVAMDHGNDGDVTPRLPVLELVKPVINRRRPDPETEEAPELEPLVKVYEVPDFENDQSRELSDQEIAAPVDTIKSNVEQVDVSPSDVPPSNKSTSTTSAEPVKTEDVPVSENDESTGIEPAKTEPVDVDPVMVPSVESAQAIVSEPAATARNVDELEQGSETAETETAETETDAAPETKPKAVSSLSKRQRKAEKRKSAKRNRKSTKASTSETSTSEASASETSTSDGLDSQAPPADAVPAAFHETPPIQAPDVPALVASEHSPPGSVTPSPIAALPDESGPSNPVLGPDPAHENEPREALAESYTEPAVDLIPELIDILPRPKRADYPAAIPVVSLDAPVEPAFVAHDERNWETRLENANSDRKMLARFFAICLCLVAIVNMVPALYHWYHWTQLTESMALPRWIYIQIFVAAIHLVYAIFLFQINDWSAMRAVSVAMLAVAFVFGFISTGLLVGGGEGNLTAFLGIPYTLNRQACIWCVAMLCLATLMSYWGGKESNNWQRAEDLLKDILARSAA